jgi:hypothetical protein
LPHLPRILARCFNWKVALLSALSRGTIFFAVTLLSGWRCAAGALAIEFVFRGLTSGLDGALAEALCGARPLWLAGGLVTVVIPLVENALEYGLHRGFGTPHLTAGAWVSLSVTAVSSLFNWYAMRQGILRTFGAQRPFLADLRLLPGTVAQFLLAVPRRLAAGERPWRAAFPPSPATAP